MKTKPVTDEEWEEVIKTIRDKYPTTEWTAPTPKAWKGAKKNLYYNENSMKNYDEFNLVEKAMAKNALEDLTDFEKFMNEEDERRRNSKGVHWGWSFWSDWKEVLHPGKYNWIDFTFLQVRYEKEFYSHWEDGRREFYIGIFGFNWRFFQTYSSE